MSAPITIERQAIPPSHVSQKTLTGNSQTIRTILITQRPADAEDRRVRSRSAGSRQRDVTRDVSIRK